MQAVTSEYTAKYDNLFRIILAVPIVLVAFGALITSRSEPEIAWGLAATLIIVSLLFWMIMPRKFLIMKDRVKFVLGANISFSILYNVIKAVRELKGASIGINFSTSFREPVEIVRSKGMNINFSPGDRSRFMHDLETAIENWRRGDG